MAIVELHPIKRRVYRGEEKWFPLLEELGVRGLRAAFIAAGQTPQVAGNLAWFIDDQLRLDRHFNPVSGTRYRQALAELNPDVVAGLATRAMPGLLSWRRAS